LLQQKAFEMPTHQECPGRASSGMLSEAWTVWKTTQVTANVLLDEYLSEHCFGNGSIRPHLVCLPNAEFRDTQTGNVLGR